MSKLISLSLNRDEQEILIQAAKRYECSVSRVIKKLVFEKLEDDFDSQVVSEYATRKTEGRLKLHNHDDVWKKLEDDRM